MRESFSGYKLRYYFNEDVGGVFSKKQVRILDVTIKLLEEIKRRLGIGYELYPFRSNEEVLLYKEHFVARSRLLNKIHDQTVAQSLKSRSGNVYLNNLIAIVKGDEIVWYHEGWRRDYELWRAKAEEVKREYGLETFYTPLHLGFLKLVLEDPQYLRSIINEVEKVIGKAEPKPTGHEMLVLKVVESIVEKRSRAAILVEVPLGLKLLRRALEEREAHSPYGLSIQSLMLSAYPLRADVVVIRDPVGLEPGIYPCARGSRQIFRLRELYEARFPSENVNVIDVSELAYMELRGTRAEIIEVKTGRISEQAIGQLLTYEALIRMDTGIRDIGKIIAAPREQVENTNPLLRLIIDSLGIKLMSL